MTTLELIKYYANLLIFQYQNKNRAYKTIQMNVTPIVMAQTSVQKISFSPSPTSGTFKLSYDGTETSSINWDDTANEIQAFLRTATELNTLTVTGSIASGLIVTFVGLNSVAEILVVSQNNLLASSNSVKITVEETDKTLPLAVQDAFNIDTAVGVQLDILGKYTGVKRTITTQNQTIILNDDEFRILMKFAIIQNNSGSSLQTIENNFNIFFPGQFIITDYKNMYMGYILAQSIVNENVIIALIKEKLIPKPMGVGFSIINPPTIDTYFGFSTYQQNGINPNAKPFNTYEDFNQNWLFLDYRDFIYP